MKAAGVEYIEASVRGFLVPLEADDVFSKHLEMAKKSPIPVEAANSFLPGNIKSVGPEMDLKKISQYAETAFRRAAQVGIEIVVFGSGGSRSIPEEVSKDKAIDQFVDVLKTLGPIAAKHRVTVVVEPLNKGECNFINSLGDGAQVVEKASHPNIQLLADIYHMTRDGQKPEDIVRYGTLLKHLHVAENEKRTAPGAMGDDFKPFLRALRQVGYDSRISFECRWENLSTQVEESVSYFRRQMAEVQ